MNPIINAPHSKPFLPSAAQTRNSTGLKIYTCIVLTLVGDQKVFSQPSHYCNFLYQGGEIHGFYASQIKIPYNSFDSTTNLHWDYMGIFGNRVKKRYSFGVSMKGFKHVYTNIVSEES